MKNYETGRIPRVIRRTSSGLHATDIVDEMFADREIQCVGDIDACMNDALCLQMRYLQKADPDAPITIFINSPGGEVTSGLAIYDVMKAVSCPVRTVCTGIAASMAALLFAAGDEREMLPHSQVMIHDPLIAHGAGGSALAVQTLSENLMRTREITARVLAEHTGRSIEEIYEKTARDTYFSAEEAVEFGLADRVIEHLYGEETGGRA